MTTLSIRLHHSHYISVIETCSFFWDWPNSHLQHSLSNSNWFRKTKKKISLHLRIVATERKNCRCHCCYPSSQDIGFLIFSVSSRHLSMLWNCSWEYVVQCQDIFSHSCGNGFVMYVRLTYKQTQQTKKRPNANWRIESNQKLLAWSTQKPQPYGFPKMQKN